MGISEETKQRILNVKLICMGMNENNDAFLYFPAFHKVNEKYDGLHINDIFIAFGNFLIKKSNQQKLEKIKLLNGNYLIEFIELHLQGMAQIGIARTKLYYFQYKNISFVIEGFY